MQITSIYPVGNSRDGYVPFGMNYTPKTKKFIVDFLSTDNKSLRYDKSNVARYIKDIFEITPPKNSDNPMSIKPDNMRNVYVFSLDGYSQLYALIKESGFCYEKLKANIQKFLECFDKNAENKKILATKFDVSVVVPPESNNTRKYFPINK